MLKSATYTLVSCARSGLRQRQKKQLLAQARGCFEYGNTMSYCCWPLFRRTVPLGYLIYFELQPHFKTWSSLWNARNARPLFKTRSYLEVVRWLPMTDPYAGWRIMLD